jgi:hypothetical protein
MPVWTYRFSDPVEPGALVTLALARFPADRALTGVVLEPGGEEERANACVRFVWDDRGLQRVVHTTTDTEGRFALLADEPGRIGALHAWVYGHPFRSTAIDPIPAGTTNVAIVLGAPSKLTLDVRDPEGQAIAGASATFAWVLAGMPYRDYPGPRQRPGEAPWWELPAIPFHVTVGAGDFQPLALGPLDPAQVGSRLVVRLERLPRLRGRVTHAGRPVAGAELSLRRRVQREPLDVELRPGTFWNRIAVTDAEGRFDVAWRLGGECELSAWSAELGGGTLGPLELDLARLPEALQIELVRPPGRIQGQVELPADHSPREIWLTASGGSGYMRLRPDGAFVLPSLPPGPTLVHVVESYDDEEDLLPFDGDWFWTSHGPARAPDWLAIEPAFEIDVRSGETVRLDIDLTAPAACRLEGRLRVNGAPPPHRPRGPDMYWDSGPRVRLDRGDDCGFVSRTELAADGTFTLQAQRPGTYRLQIDVPTAGGHEWVLFDRVRLERGTRSWEQDLPAGTLRVLPSEAGGELTPFEGHVRWQGPDSLRVFARFAEADAATRAVVYHVPAGRIELCGDTLAERSVLLVTDVPARGTQTVTSP